MPKWDTERLLADCDLRMLAPYVGLRTKKSGSTTYIECMSGLHSESDINHMVCDRNGCYCFSCHGSYDGFSEHNDAISTIRQFRRVYGGDDSFDAACETIAEFLGGRDRYILSGETGRSQRKGFPYTSEELTAAGFSGDQASRKSIRELYERDEVFCKSVILGKIEETVRKLKIIVRSDDTALSDAAASRLEVLGAFYEKVSGKKLHM